ncbi:hypothetical protein QE152_g27243 [Popillia japonica]|uniref:Uncharacterized protein n=1 Tax=Popillia japonica TaxID=7064 RepID=A0AAW1JTZ2_POPJA
MKDDEKLRQFMRNHKKLSCEKCSSSREKSWKIVLTKVLRSLGRAKLGHSGIKQSPFEALFGRRAKLGLAEEDVEKITRDVAEAGSSEVEKPVEVQSFTGEKKFVENEDIAIQPKQKIEKPVEVQSFTGEKKFVENKFVENEDIAIQPKQKISSQRNTSNNVEIQSTTMLAVAAKITETETCEDMNELKEPTSGLEEQAKRMKMHSEYKFPPIEKETTVKIPVPDVDRSKGDLRNLIGIVMEVTPDSFYNTKLEQKLVRFQIYIAVVRLPHVLPIS